MPDLTRLYLSHFFPVIFTGIYLGTLRIRLISHLPITICLEIFIGVWGGGNNFHRMQKWKHQSKTTSKNWTKIFMLFAFQSYLTAVKNLIARLCDCVEK